MRSDILDFLNGYLSARGNVGSEITLTNDYAVVRYRQPMGRSSELFYWGNGYGQLPLEPGMWLTVIGAEAAASLPVLPPSMHKLVDEYLMKADMPLNAKAAADISVVEIKEPDAVKVFNHSRLFAAISSQETDRYQAAFFLGKYQGRIAASARYGWAKPDLAVVDHVMTLPAFRRHGLGESLMAAMAAKASEQGTKRMLLISSEQGRRLYERIGFRMLAPVVVYQHIEYLD